MNEQVATIASSLPAWAFLLPFTLGVLVFLGRRLGPRPAQWLAIAGSLAVALLGIEMARHVIAGRVLVGWGNELRVDGLSALLVLAIGVVATLTAVYSLPYVRQPGLLTRVGALAERRLPTFYGLFLWFIATMVWGCVTNNIVMLYVAVEATTLTSGLLVAFYWDRRALEAGYKYLMLLTIGITFALFGCVLTYAAAVATRGLSGSQALLISEVRGVAGLIPPGTALIAVAFLVVGFGTKAGIAPFHPWLPDAHAEAPTPISVLLSGVMIKMAVYALARTVSMFYPRWPALAIFVVALGVFTMVLGIVMALVQDDLKRLLAYSSVSQIGYVVAGVGLGTYLGCYGGLFHLLNHALIKALLFMCVGALIYATGARRISELAGIRERMPITSACFVIGALAIAGLPPFNGFLSKLTVYLALARAGMWWALAIAVAAGLLTMVVLLRAARTVFWGHAPASAAAVREVPATMWVPMVVLAAACVVLGVFPRLSFPLLDRAATVLATLGR
jgi:hydrogenase-4 component F